MSERCHHAIKFGVTLHTRCLKDADHQDHGSHVGRGLQEFPGQVIEWFESDRRAYLTDREEEYAWEDPP